MSNSTRPVRRDSPLAAPRLAAFLGTLACPLACASPGDVVADGDGTSGSDGAPGTSLISWGSDSEEVDATYDPGSSEGATTTGSAQATGGSDAATDDGLGSESGATVDTGSGPVAGDWCGNQGTGAAQFEGTTGASFVDLSAPYGAPLGFAIWESAAGIGTAIYDIAAASWSDPEMLTGVDPDAAAAAVDAGGDALVVYTVDDATPHTVVRHYDAATAVWSPATPLEGSLEDPYRVGVSTTAGGNAIVVVEDYVSSEKTWLVHWFHDAASEKWSAPLVVGPMPYGERVPWAQDPITGDAAFVVRFAADHVQLRHWSASTGAWTIQDITDVVTNLGAGGVVSIGDGAFVALTRDSGFQTVASIHAHVFSEGSWQPHKSLGVGNDLHALRIAGSTDGRALMSWFWSPNVLHARVFDIRSGWGSDWLVNSRAQQTDGGWWNDAQPVLDDGGFIVAWSQRAGGLIRTFARRYDAVGGWDVQSELDPVQPWWSRIRSIDALGADLTRAVWREEDQDGHTTGFFYACHTPGGTWSAPTSTPISKPELEPHSAGVLVRGRDETGELTAEYYEAL